MRKSIFLLFLLLLLGVPSLVDAAPINLTFSRITTNSTTNIASQLSAAVYNQSDALGTWSLAINSDQVLFVFKNNVGTASNVAEIYFDDGTILSQSALHNSLGGGTNNSTNFGQCLNTKGSECNPADLPSGSSVGFQATLGFGADAQGQNGLNHSADRVGIVITLQSGLGFSDVHDALVDETLRIGLHVRGLPGSKSLDSESDSFVNEPATPPAGIPEPASLLLLLTGLGLGFLKRRK